MRAVPRVAARIGTSTWAGLTLVAKKIVEHPVWTLLIGLATVAAVFTPFLVGGGSGQGPETPATSGTTNSSASATLPSPSNGAATSPPVGSSTDRTPTTCYQVAGGKAVEAACFEPHNAELVTDANSCTEDAVITYLGGEPGKDIVSPQPDTTGLVGRCLVDLLREVSSASGGSLLHDEVGEWRVCYQTDIDHVVACSIRHRGEFLPTGLPGPASVDSCKVAASDYMESPYDSRSQDLTVTPIENAPASTAASKCVLRTRVAGRVLTRSLRALRDHTTPVE